MSNLPVHNNLILTLKPIFTTCSFVGLSPFVLTKNGEIIPNFWGIVKTILALIHHILVLIYVDSSLRVYFRENLLDTVLDIQDTSWGIFTLVIVILELTGRKKLIQILYDLEKINTNLENFGSTYNIFLSHDCVKFVLKRCVPILVSTTIVAVYSDYTLHLEFDVVMFFATVVFYVCFVVTLPLFVVKFVMFNFLITRRLEIVNGIVEKCGREQKFVVS